MNVKKALMAVLALAILNGCAARQEITQLEQAIPKSICIAKHEAVREGVVKALSSSFNRHGMEVSTIPANYVLKHREYAPEVAPKDVNGCEAVAFYTANWAWDLATYMAHANIWITDPGMQKKIAQASYTTGGGLDKFINAEEKINELVDSMLQQK